MYKVMLNIFQHLNQMIPKPPIAIDAGKLGTIF